MTCETCGSEMWDNREKVRGGWKGPLYKCKDKACGTVVWPPKDAAAVKRVTAQVAGDKWTWMKLGKLYERALLTAEMRVLASAERLGIKASVSDVLQATATIFIEAARNGVEEPKKALPPKPEPVAEPEEDEDIGF